VLVRQTPRTQSAAGADRPHIPRGQLRATVATARVAVPHVFRVGAWIQMTRIHTRRVVARVADVLAFGDWTVVQFPRNAMCAFLSYLTTRAAFEQTVTHHGRLLSTPRPALIRAAAVDLEPKPFLAGLHRLCRTSASHRAEAATALVAYLSTHGFPTVLARVFNESRHAVIVPKAVAA
jgi:hypothetical protein